MSSLVARFATRMYKRAASGQRETNSSSEGPYDKQPKQSSPDREVQKSPAVITVDSLERAPNALPSSEATTQGVHGEACASLEDGISVGGPPNTNNVMGEAPSIETTVVPLVTP